MEEPEFYECSLGRKASPVFEMHIRTSLVNIFRELVSSKHLYQKCEISLAELPALFKAEGYFPSQPELHDLYDEARLRPWRILTHHLGDDETMAGIFRRARAGCSPVGTPKEDLWMEFYAPGVQLHCRECGTMTTFSALGGPLRNIENGYKRKGTNGTEQVFTLGYRCESCRKSVYVILIRREGLKAHLCGFAPRRQQVATRVIPKKFECILLDATNSVAEGDVYAGFYHLRTLIEHYAKDKLNLASEDRIRGDDLVKQYNLQLHPTVKGLVPSFGPIYETLSGYMHARTGTSEDFQKHLNSVCDHIEAVALFSRMAGAKSS